MKRKILIGASTLLLLTSCNPIPLEEESFIKTFLEKARSSFEMDSTSRQIVTNSATKEKMFENVTSYHYIFEDKEGARVDQTISFKQNGEDEEARVAFKRNEDGYVAQEYVNYKNEVDEFLVLDDEGNASMYDQYFYNPFHFIFEEDLIQDETNSSLYHLNSKKVTKFEYFLEAKGVASESVDFLFEEKELKSITLKSHEISGKAHDPQEGIYVPASWVYEDTLLISKLGEAQVESPILSERNEYQEEISQLFNKVGDNYTLTLSLTVKDGEASDETTQVVYFDGESCYVDNNKALLGHEGNKLYKKDDFKDDGLLYEYEFNESKSWSLTKNSEAGSYNISPKDKTYFSPHVKEINPALFTKSKFDKSYECNNDYAKAFVGAGFFSDFNALPFFSYGYGLGATVKYDSGQKALVASLPFYYVLNGGLYELVYEISYSNLGTTSLPL